MVQKIYSKMHSILCTNIHHDVTDLVNHRMVKNTKLEDLENGTWFFYEIEKFLSCASDDTSWEVIVF